MSASDPGLRRVSVHAGTAVVDLSLPAGVPVATLIPPIVDMLEGRDSDSAGGLAGRCYHLSLPGAPALDASTTLAQHGIRDGSVMVLSQERTPPAAPRHDDVAEAVLATLRTTARGSGLDQDGRATRLTGAAAASLLAGVGALTLIRNACGVSVARHPGATAAVAAVAGCTALLFAVVAHRVLGDSIAGLTLGAIATVFAAVAGFLAVPGPPGAGGVLLAAMGVAVVSVLAMRLSGCGFVTLTAVSCAALVVAVAALASVFTAAPPRSIASVSALVSFGLLGMAARVSIVLAGLSPRLQPDVDAADRLAAKAIRADNWLTGLLAAFAGSAALGAVVTALTGAPSPGCIAFAAVTGSLLLLYARGVDTKRRLIFVVTGIATIGTTFGVVAVGSPDRGPWIAGATSMLAAAATYLGFAAPAISPSPVLRRGVELLECLALIAMVPLTCWICGLYGVVRGLNPPWS
ncbi:type VII secretion integral membrane protein EccD [Mycobacterium sp. 663a-19]|uniref:type VII secretion integral membrane protein EccD n=1 Tax=Mycobacterium sp. 663a-19 TaxID=2986148 RepID=UPI002D1F7D8B|nr:type VII secretion integral membrane protein EccD [Mycobacterium sp. 663a-19]MEB3983003.1 type VII secretion integral membrane protein EccD [Mycobacterium sp. 663a-19]